MSKSQGKLAPLEGLRGIAAFVVLLGHLRYTFFIESTRNLTDRFGLIFRTMFEAFFDGNFAVWLFWVMSGFVLSVRFHSTRQTEKSFSQMTDAAVRRYPRLLLPVLASVGLAWTFHTCGLMTNVQLAEMLGPAYAKWLGSFYLFEPDLFSAIQSAAWQSFFAYDSDSSYNIVLWTMEKELYGSYFLFGLLCLIGKHPARWLFYFATFLIVNQLSIHWINAFVLGTMLCDGWVQRTTILKAMPASWVRCFRLLNSHWLFPVLLAPGIIFLIGLPNLAGVFHLLLATGVTGYVVVCTPLHKLFGHPMLVFLGKISFGLYLTHVPIICALAYPCYIALTPMTGPEIAAGVTTLVLTVVSLFSGWCLWYFADRTAITFARRVAKTVSGCNAPNL